MNAWLPAPTLADATALLLALGIGLMIGLERERHPAARAGLRTFALIALSGWLIETLAHEGQTPWLLAAALLALAATMIAAHWRDETDPGTTTTAAALVALLLGALVARGDGGLAVMIAIVTTVLLYMKTELHGISARLTPTELRSMLQFAVLALVILPLLPNRDMGPFLALNPYQVWLMAVLICGVGLAGYAALRLLGAGHGALVAGLFGGLVSSTATTLEFSRRAHAGDMPAGAAATTILIANSVVFVRLGALGFALAAPLAPQLAGRLALAVAPALALLIWQGWQSRGTRHEQALALGNPANVRGALGFALLYAVVLVSAAALNHWVGARGLYLVALASGITDVDAITLSAFRLFNLGSLEPGRVITMVLLALSANCVFKATLVVSIARGTLMRRVVPALALMTAGLLIAAAA
ncbi:MgtC/SapB family protein [Chitinibacteraceae bacterium HSL-7]